MAQRKYDLKVPCNTWRWQLKPTQGPVWNDVYKRSEPDTITPPVQAPGDAPIPVRQCPFLIRMTGFSRKILTICYLILPRDKKGRIHASDNIRIRLRNMIYVQVKHTVIDIMANIITLKLKEIQKKRGGGRKIYRTYQTSRISTRFFNWFYSWRMLSRSLISNKRGKWKSKY